VPEASRTALGRFKPVDRQETGLFYPAYQQLGDAVPAVYLVRRNGVCVHKYDRDLAAVTRVDQTWRVEAADPVPGGEPASRENEAGVALGDGERDPRRDRRPPTGGSQQGARSSHEVATCVPRLRVTRRGKIDIQTNEWNLEHDSAP